MPYNADNMTLVQILNYRDISFHMRQKQQHAAGLRTGCGIRVQTASDVMRSLSVVANHRINGYMPR
jgi:hypothetical protein